MSIIPPPIRTLRPGQYLFREGEPSQSLFLIKKGTLAIRKMKGGAYVELARLFQNEVVGELSFFDRAPRNASAVAVNEVELMELTFDSLDKIYKNVPDYLKTIMASVAERLRKADETIRRLQKNTFDEDESVGNDGGELMPSAADVLAATADINFDEVGDDSDEESDAEKKKKG